MSRCRCDRLERRGEICLGGYCVIDYFRKGFQSEDWSCPILGYLMWSQFEWIVINFTLALY